MAPATPANPIIERMRSALAPLSPSLVEIEDDSHKHAGHAGAASGGGHYRLTIVSTAFAGEKPLARHRHVYQQLGALMQRDIHALAITALTPEEAAGRR